jgi:outer membrane biosynthesis protein TonB
VTAHVGILDQPDRLRGAFLGAVALHGALIGGLFLSKEMASHRTSFGTQQAGGNAIGVQAVNTIPLVHHGSPNPVANDTESEIPQTPVKAPDRVKAEPPPKDAIPLKMRKAKQKPAEVASARQRFRPLNELLPNQLTSPQAPQVANQAFSAVPGAGRLGTGPSTTLGDRCAGYADQLRQIVGSKWRTGDVTVQSAPIVIATFDLLRDGSIKNLELLQRSGNTSLDLSVQRAVQESAPFPPITCGYDRGYASVEFWFELKR